MSKIVGFRALGEESKGSDSDEDGPRNRPTREAQEVEATTAYNKALQLICSCDIEQVELGVASLEALLDSAYLNDDRENWCTAHRQRQMRTGCLKILSQTYLEVLSEPKLAEPLLLEALEMEPDNVILWIRLGSANSKLVNYTKAYHAFARGLKCSPHNWICIESLVTLSYVILDWPQCLYFCAIGLEKDSKFIRGMVFRDEILVSHPYIGNLDFLADHQGCLQLRGGYDESWKNRYFEEVNMLRQREQDYLDQLKTEDNEKNHQAIHCTTRMKSLTFVELAQTLIDFREYIVSLGTLLRPIDMSGCTKEYNSEVDEEDAGHKYSSDLTDEATRCSTYRSRSGSDDKETVPTLVSVDKEVTENPSVEDVQQSSAAVRDKENFDSQQKAAGADDECSQSQVTCDGEQGASEVESTSPKKKRGKDAKWWQYEGKRRSQRVRGHLMPSTQSQSKNSQQRGFEETLKNLIPASLLYVGGEDMMGNEFELTNNTGAVDSDGNYFGTQSEINDVKNFLAMYGKSYIGEIISQLTILLSKLCSHTWPAALVPLYLQLCRLHRDRVKELSEWTEEEELLETLKEDAVINLSILELLLDSISSSEIEMLKSDVDFMSKTFYLDTVCSLGLRNELLFNIRVNWFRMKYGITLANVGLASYKDPLHHLKEIQQLLTQLEEREGKDNKDPITIKLATKLDNIITAEEVRKKIRFVQKMESINQINDLYQGRNFESLIDILSFCLTSEDYGGADLVNRYYLAESYFHVGKFTECIEQIVKIISPCTKGRMDQILSKCLNLLEKVCGGEGFGAHENVSKLQMKEKRSLTNAMIQVLTSNENRNNIPEAVVILPWCILHSILFNLENQEPILYLDGEMVPHSIVLLQFAHEFLNRSNKCTLDNGKMLTYTIQRIYPIRGSDEYGSFDETKHCIEQAIFCLYSHPSKKSKLKYLNEHSTQGISLEWSKCLQLYEYYSPTKLPEFDSYDSISADVEGLFQRILTVMPEELKPSVEDYEKMKLVLEGTTSTTEGGTEQVSSNKVDFPTAYSNLYYLLGDHFFKTKEWTKAVEYYTYDLTVTTYRFDSWAAIALAKGEMINSKLNACENYKLEEVITNANVVVNCFRHALDLEPENSKIRIEFGSFAYAMHSFCSRLLKQGMEQQQLSFEMFEMVERKKGEFLKSASICFEPVVVKNYHPGNASPEDDQHEELWIHHYMLGKVMEKLNPSDVEKYLTQYETAGNRIHEQGAPYPAKINFYNPPELAIEALEIYYRIHASILGYIDKHEYDVEKEKIFCGFVERAASSPFIKCKLSRGGGTEASEQRKRKATEGAKKEQAEIEALMKDMLDKVETMVGDGDDSSSTTSSPATTLSGSSDGELSTDYETPAPPPPPPVQSFGLAAFCEQLRKKESQNMLKAAESSSTPVVSTTKSSEVLQQDNSSKPSSTNLPPSSPSTTTTTVSTAAAAKVEEEIKFYKDFVDVKYGKIVTQCLAALEECILRFPQHHKSYYRIVYAYYTIAKNKLNVCRDYFIGNPSSDKKKIVGLFLDRKANNFFNGVWRNPVDDIDRPGSFPYHMSRTIQIFLEILDKLNDHQTLAEIGIALAKIPDHDKQYLYNFERQQFSQQALTSCAAAAKRFFSQVEDVKTGVISIFETYQKLQKFNSKENVLANVLLGCYTQYRQQFGIMEEVTLEEAFRFFQQVTWASKTNSIGSKSAPGSQTNSTGTTIGMKRKKDTTSRLSSSRLKDDGKAGPSNLSTSFTGGMKQGPDCEVGFVPRKKAKTSTELLRMRHEAMMSNYNRGKVKVTDRMGTPKQQQHHLFARGDEQNIAKKNIEESEIIDLTNYPPGPDEVMIPWKEPSTPDVEEIDPLSTTPPKKVSSIENTTTSIKNISGSSIQTIPQKNKSPQGIPLRYLMESRDDPLWTNTWNVKLGTSSGTDLKQFKKKTAQMLRKPVEQQQQGQVGNPPSAHQNKSSSYPPSDAVTGSNIFMTSSSSKLSMQHQGSRTMPSTMRPSSSSTSLSTSSNVYVQSLNTSPYKAQSTVLSSPMAHKQIVSEQSKSSVAPPAAHVQSSRRVSSEHGDDGGQEIIDLTTKTPSPNKDSPSTSRRDGGVSSDSTKTPKPKQLYFLPQPTFNKATYPLPPKKKARIALEQAVVEKAQVTADMSEDLDVIIIDDN